LDGLGLEEENLRRNLFTDQHNRGADSADYNRTNNPVSLMNSAISTIQPSMTNTMGYPSAVGESRQQLVVTHKLPQFTSFLGDNWRKFIIKWSDYSISVGSNCRSISESTSILCKQQASMFFDTEIWILDNNRLKEILNNHFRVVTTHDIYARL
jgi:hypothetical protein